MCVCVSRVCAFGLAVWCSICNPGVAGSNPTECHLPGVPLLSRRLHTGPEKRIVFARLRPYRHCSHFPSGNLSRRIRRVFFLFACLQNVPKLASFDPLRSQFVTSRRWMVREQKKNTGSEVHVKLKNSRSSVNFKLAARRRIARPPSAPEDS